MEEMEQALIKLGPPRFKNIHVETTDKNIAAVDCGATLLFPAMNERVVEGPISYSLRPSLKEPNGFLIVSNWELPKSIQLFTIRELADSYHNQGARADHKGAEEL